MATLHMCGVGKLSYSTCVEYGSGRITHVWSMEVAAVHMSGVRDSTVEWPQNTCVE